MRRDFNPVATDVTSILNFLASLAEGGLAYRTVNTFRSAISAGHIPLEGVPVGEHPLVCRLLRGIRLSLPPELRYSRLWDVNLVLNLFLSWQPNRYLSRKELSAKLAMLLCLISCRRVSDVRALDVTSRVFSPSGLLSPSVGVRSAAQRLFLTRHSRTLRSCVWSRALRPMRKCRRSFALLGKDSCLLRYANPIERYPPPLLPAG